MRDSVEDENGAEIRVALVVYHSEHQGLGGAAEGPFGPICDFAAHAGTCNVWSVSVSLLRHLQVPGH